MIETLGLTVAFLGLAIGSYTDLRTREVPDWVNFFLIAAGIGMRLMAAVTYSDMGYIYQGLFGAAIGTGLALLMFYAGQWGGGDSKMIIGLGIIFGFQLRFDSLLVSFLVNLLFVGAIYGLLFSLYLAVKNGKRFAIQFKKNLLGFKKIRILNIILLIIGFGTFILASDFSTKMLVLVLTLFIVFTIYLWVFVKTIETSCMLKQLSPDKLTEGDWVAKEVKIDGKYVCGPKDLGLSKKQIRLIKKYYSQNKLKQVLVKEGIPFVPSFFISFLVSLTLGNLILVLTNAL